MDIKGVGLTSEEGAIKGAIVAGTNVVAGVVVVNGRPDILVIGGIAGMLLAAGVVVKGGRMSEPANRFGADVFELKVG